MLLGSFSIVIIFFVLFAVIYTLMRFSCYVKRKYSQTENWFYKRVTLFMNLCEDCKKACESHTKLVIRAAFFSAVLTIVIAITRHCG